LIWQKAYVMERERFDGADIVHLLASCAPGIDWKRLMERFGPDWRVLMSHLILFVREKQEEHFELDRQDRIASPVQRLSSKNT
jgi:hypothetical protein